MALQNSGFNKYLLVLLSKTCYLYSSFVPVYSLFEDTDIIVAATPQNVVGTVECTLVNTEFLCIIIHASVGSSLLI